MSGPLPETGPEGSTRVPTGACELDARQWQALARLAERYAALEDAAAGPLGDVATQAALKTSGLLRDHDLPKLANEVLEAAQALSRAGVFTAISENASPAKETLGRAVDAQSIKRMGATVLELREELRTAQRLVTRLEAIEGWFEGPAAGALAQAFVRLLDATRDTDVTGLGRDLLRILKTLSETGVLGRLADNLPYLVDTVTRLSRLAPSLLDAAGPVLEQARADLAFAHTLADMGRGVAEIWQGPTGEALARAATELSAWASQHDAVGLAQEIAALLASWRRAGVFPAVHETGLSLAGLASSLEQVQKATSADGQSLKDLTTGVSQVLDRWRRIRTGDADGQGDSPGGIRGLYQLLTEARVQDGLRQGALLLQALMDAGASTHGPARDH